MRIPEHTITCNACNSALTKSLFRPLIIYYMHNGSQLFLSRLLHIAIAYLRMPCEGKYWMLEEGPGVVRLINQKCTSRESGKSHDSTERVNHCTDYKLHSSRTQM